MTGGEFALLVVLVVGLFIGFWTMNRRFVGRADASASVDTTDVNTGYVSADHPIANMTGRARHLRQLAASTDDSQLSGTLIRMADEEEADANSLDAERLGRSGRPDTD